MVGAVVLVRTMKPGSHGREGTWLISATDWKVDCFKAALVLQVDEL